MLKKMFQWGVICLFLFVLVFLFCSLNKAYIKEIPNRLKLYLWPTVTLEQIIASHPEVRIQDKKENIITVPYGELDHYAALFKKIEGVSYVSKITVKPQFSLEAYALENVKQIKQYLHGDFGSIMLRGSKQVIPMKEQIKMMLPFSLFYLIGSLLLSIIAGIVLSVIAAINKRAGKCLDGLHVIFLSVPDFALITIIQLLAIYLTRWIVLDNRLVLLYQVGSEKPVLIPLLTISLIPTVLIYGILRMAIQRELAKNYIMTASAIGLSFSHIIVKHVLRNVWEDLLTILPKATTMAISSLVITEVICNITGVGGYMFNSGIIISNALPFTTLVLIVITIGLNGIYALARRVLIPSTKEVA
jgi:oligopeptide transport system permease protein